jgi:ribose 5-phosphate isomerase B
MRPSINVSKVGLASDHAGFELKEQVAAMLAEKGLAIQDFGTNSLTSTDYPDYAHALGRAITTGDVDYGVAICGSGQGICMTVNKHLHVRGALVWAPELAEMTRRHNNANVLCLPARYISLETAKEIVDVFFATEFEGGRHQTRIDKIDL